MALPYCGVSRVLHDVGIANRILSFTKVNLGGGRDNDAPQRLPFFATTCVLGFLAMTGFGVYNLSRGHSLDGLLGLATAAVAVLAFAAALRARRLLSGFILIFLGVSLPVPVGRFHYGPEFKVRYVIAYGLLCVLSYVFESVRVRLATETAKTEKELRDLNSHIAKLSITDSLTGCYNRLHFDERLPGEMKKSLRYESPLAPVICDIDYLKCVNDTFGHQVCAS